VHHPDIPRVEPPVFETTRGSFGVFKVSQHHTPSSHHNLPHAHPVALHTLPARIHHVNLRHPHRPHSLPRLQPRPLLRRQPIPLLLPRARHHQSPGFGQPVPVTHHKPERLRPVEHRRRRRRSRGQYMNRSLQRFIVRGVCQHAEHHWRAAHVCHVISFYERVNNPGVELANADVGAAHGSDSPREAPAVSVEYRERPEINRTLGNRPVDKRIDGDYKRSSVTVNNAFRRRRRSRRVVKYHGVPLRIGPDPLEVGIALAQQALVCVNEITGQRNVCVLDTVVGDENQEWALTVVFREERQGFEDEVA